jgi:hypothetical protein
MVMAATTVVAEASVSRWSLSQERVNFIYLDSRASN